MAKRVIEKFMVITNQCIWKHIIILFLISGTSAYWDEGTSTIRAVKDKLVRTSRFIWLKSEDELLRLLFPNWDWYEIAFRRRLYVVAGITYGFVNLGTATILNARTLLTSANYLDPYMDRQTELRIWALGRNGRHNTPWRYRVWRVTRLFPRSLNPEHCHGPYCYHSPRHDLAIIHSYDQMYIYTHLFNRFAYAFKGFVPHKYDIFDTNDIWYSGSGFESLNHIHENYRIVFATTRLQYIVDCSKYIPKWWGKFICVVNHQNFPGIQNGAGLYRTHVIFGIGSFEIRYNEDRIFVFTDIRYYVSYIYLYAHLYPGEYYEYAYPQWGVKSAYLYDDSGNFPFIPGWQIRDDMYPMGKK